MVMVDARGAVLRRGLVAVPDHLPQTSHTAEGLALVVSIRSLTHEARVSGDCKSVVEAANAPCARLLAARRKLGGLLADTLRDPARRRLAGGIKWVKAHRQLHGGEDPETERDIRGNNAADEAAKEARVLHPPPGDEAAAWTAYYLKGASFVAKVAAPPPLPSRPWQHVSAAAAHQRQAGANGGRSSLAVHGWGLALRGV